MIKVNPHYEKLAKTYLFAEISRKVAKFQNENPQSTIIRLGIGDVTKPIAPAITQAMHQAIDDLATAERFHGYGPEQGYAFLRDAIRDNDYLARDINIQSDEIFISDGSKCDVANIQELFDIDTKVAIGDPVYPVYLESNVMAGRTGHINNGHFDNIIYLESTSENNFSPALPTEVADLIYLCSPNNPTGTVLNRDELTKWVKYAKENNSIILFDSAYEAYITDPSLPRSIYEIEGAHEVAIEFRSFSKTAGFTGLRCAYTVVPHAININGISLNQMWNRRTTTKFNGASYPIQRGAAAIFSQEGKQQVASQIQFYMQNASLIKNTLKECGFEVFGGENAPYIWWKLPQGTKSMDFFDTLLENCQVVGTPGVGFGPCGEGYFRLTAFGSRENTIAALSRIKKFFTK
ncbi:MAG: LL-diaminopimelate aminotransferase [Lentisphaeria bacterium]